MSQPTALATQASQAEPSHDGLGIPSGPINTQDGNPSHVSHTTSNAISKGVTSVKRKAQLEYIRSARIVAQILHAFEGHEPATLLQDVRNLPDLVRSNMETAEYLEISQDTIDNNQRAVDHLVYLEERVAQVYGVTIAPDS